MHDSHCSRKAHTHLQPPQTMERNRELDCPSSPDASPEAVAFASMLAGTRGLELMEDIMEARNFTNIWARGKEALARREARNQGPSDGSSMLGTLGFRTNARNQGVGAGSATDGASVFGTPRQQPYDSRETAEEAQDRHDINQNESVTVFFDREISAAIQSEDIQSADQGKGQVPSQPTRGQNRRSTSWMRQRQEPAHWRLSSTTTC